MKKDSAISENNPFTILNSAVLARVNENVPVVLSQGFTPYVKLLKQKFAGRHFLLTPGVSLIPFSAGLSLSLRLKEKEKRDLNVKLKDNHDVVVFAEAGVTLSYPGMLYSELTYPQANLLYVCFDSQVYSATSGESFIQTPLGARTTSCAVDLRFKGNPQEPVVWWQRLPLSFFSYAAQLSYSHLDDFIQKVDKALNLKGFRYLHLLAPSPLYWRFLNEETPALMKLAVETGFWPLFEVEGQAGKISLEIKQIKGLSDFYKRQGRFYHLFSEVGQPTLKRTEKYLQDLWKDLRNKLKTAPAKS